MSTAQEFERLAQSRFQFLLYATRIVRNHADAEDAVQRAMFKAWCSLDSYASAGTLGAWLYTILSNECKLLLRHRRIAKTAAGRIAQEYCRTYDPDPEQVFRRKELQRVLHREIDRLPRNFRQILLADLASTEEHNRSSALGAITGKNTGAAKSLLSRARKGLRDRMEAHVS